MSCNHLTETDLCHTVKDILDSYRWRVEDQGLRLDISLDEGIPPVAHDRHGVTQMVLNLVDNAVKYAAAGGVVQVMLRAADEGVELLVIDHGPGIAPEERERLRKPFERGKEADPASGSGLGLALVEQIATVHHAQFILTTPQGGTGVKALVRFPVYKAKS